MANPKTIYKANGVEVTIIETSKEVKKAIEGLSKTALRAAGKVVRKKLRENIPVNSNNLKNHIGTWVFIERETGIPKMQVGLYSWQRVKKRNKIPSSMSPHWVELGTKPHSISVTNAKMLAYNDIVYGRNVMHPGNTATHFLRDTVYNNIGEIRAAQEEYLAEITKAIDEAKKKIDEGDEFEDDD